MTDLLHRKLLELHERHISDALCARLKDLIRNGEPAALARMAPPRLAREWGEDTNRVLDAFLHGTRLGLFELEWDLRCPSCTGPSQRGATLAQVAHSGNCDMCRVDYDGSFDESIEVVWRVHPAVRDVSQVDARAVFTHYAQAEPVLQLTIPGRGEVSREQALSAGNYHIFSSRGGTGCGIARGMRLDAQAAAPAGELDITLDDAELDRGAWHRSAGRYQLRLHNRSSQPVELVLARVADQPWVSGAALAANQSFRDLFSRELIQPGENFAIRHTAFVFTDIKGSTALYERIGDARAYALVRDHFQIMIEQVRAHGGAVVKTIGDAIMATFLDPAAATRFAVDVLRAFDAYNAQHQTGDSIIVKIGVHAGPCLAVTLNERLDYFGRTVNLAARIQGLSVGRDLVLSQAIASAPEVGALLEQTGWRAEKYGAELKGIAGECPVVRLQQPAV